MLNAQNVTEKPLFIHIQQKISIVSRVMNY